MSIPESVKSLGNKAFSDCINLLKVTIPEGVLSIGNDTFSGCTNLTNITIPDTVKSIGSNAFAKCSSLKNAIISDGVESIGERIFSGCTNLSTVYYTGLETFTAVTGFDTCDVLEALCVPPDFVPDSFLGCNVTSNSSVCQAFQRLFNHCFLPKVFGEAFIQAERTNASEWHARTFACATFMCENDVGGVAWGECNTSDKTVLCVGDQQCVDKKEMKRDVSVEIDLDAGVSVTDISSVEITHTLEVSVEIPPDANLTIAWENNDKGDVISVIVYVNDEDTADNIASVVKDIKKGENCTYGTLCNANGVRVIAKKSENELSGVQSIHGLSIIMMLFILFAYLL